MTTEKRHIICVTCPVGCEVDVEVKDGEVVSMTGNRCKKGQEFVRQEIREPMRTLTTTVAIRGARWAMLPVRTDRAIPRRLFSTALKELGEVEMQAPVGISRIIADNVAGTDASVLATRSMERTNNESGQGRRDRKGPAR